MVTEDEMDIKDLNRRVSAAREETEARGETFYPGPSRVHLASFPPKERWDDWVELDPGAWPELGRATRVLNVHMTHPMVFPPWRSLPERSYQLNRIITHADGYDAMVLGDLNAAPGWPVHRRLSRSLDDAAWAAAAVRGERADPTWSLRPAGRALLRIDHVFTDGVSISDLWVVPIPGSDHSAIIFDIAS